jgi:short-subunit dehydrogenase
MASSIFDPNATDFGPFSVAGVLSYFRAAQRTWLSENVQFAAAIVGTVSIGLAVQSAIKLLWLFIRPSNIQAYCHAERGSWALVTGATDGIGRGFAEALLSKGFNVLLHGRNPEKLARVQSELAETFPRRQISTVVADANASGPDSHDAYTHITSACTTLPNEGKLTVLVNNVGGLPSAAHSGFYRPADLPHDFIDGVINMNARFPTHLTRALLPLLKANGPSLILNCGSMVSQSAPPFLSTYVATKAYIEGLTKALHADLTAEEILFSSSSSSSSSDNKKNKGENKKTEVLGFWIGNVLSGNNKTNVPFFTLTSRECAEGCLARVGCGRVMTWPSWRVWLMLKTTELMPTRTREKLVARQMGGRVGGKEE